MVINIEASDGRQPFTRRRQRGILHTARNIAAGGALVLTAAGAAVIGVRGIGGGESHQNSAVNAGNTINDTKQEKPPQNSPELSFKAPDFALKSIDGQTVRLSDYEGKPVIIFYWGEPTLGTGNETGPGGIEMTNLTNSIIELVAQNKDKGVVLLTVAFDARDAEGIAGITSPILIDDPRTNNGSSGPSISEYLMSYPSVAFVKPDGTFTIETDAKQEAAFLQSQIDQLPKGK